MKNIITFCFVAILSLIAYAQENPNRMIVHESSGQYKAFLAERIDSITFLKLEGRVAADVEILDVTLEKLKVKVIKTSDCQAFKLACIPTVTANMLITEAATADFINQQSTDMYYENFTSGEVSGIDLRPNSEYVFMTLGIDKYGIPCSVSKATFTTPRDPLIGDPKVATSIDNVGEREFTASFVPNEDVDGYAAVAGEKGTMLAQYEMMGAMMGFHNFGDLVKSWGINKFGPSSFTWNDMEPNTEYEIFVQAWDKEGTYADVDTILVTTKKSGGPGAATVDIQIGEYKLMDWDGEMKPSQFFTFVPNDQSSCYRFAVYYASDYDEDPEGCQGFVRMDPPRPIVNWFFYDSVTTDFQIDPNSEMVVVAAAKNGDSIWGECVIKRYTTPAEVSGAPAYAPKVNKNSTVVKSRVSPKHQINVETGKVPNLFMQRKGIQMINK